MKELIAVLVSISTLVVVLSLGAMFWALVILVAAVIDSFCKGFTEKENDDARLGR